MFTRVTEVCLPPLIFALVFEASRLATSVRQPQVWLGEVPKRDRGLPSTIILHFSFWGSHALSLGFRANLKIVLNLFIDQDNLKNCLWTSYLTCPQMENFEASPVASNFSIVLKPTSKIVLNLSRDQNNLKKLSLDLIFNLSSNWKLRPVKWPLTFQQFESRPQTGFLITCPMSMDLMFNLSSIKL